VLSQVILSLQLGFAIIPLIHFTSDKKTMGNFAIKPLVIVVASLITVVLIYLNIRMVAEQATSFFTSSDNIYWKSVIIVSSVFYLVLLVVTTVYPLMNKKPKSGVLQIHAEAGELQSIPIPIFKKIAIALEFSAYDPKLIAYAVGQGNPDSTYVLMHIVESVPAGVLGKESDDLETRKDKERLEDYVLQLQNKGYATEGFLGYRSRAKEIIRIVNESKADMLVIGAHRHTALKDLIYGETVNTVRHELKIPVLVVNL